MPHACQGIQNQPARPFKSHHKMPMILLTGPRTQEAGRLVSRTVVDAQPDMASRPLAQTPHREFILLPLVVIPAWLALGIVLAIL